MAVTTLVYGQVGLAFGTAGLNLLTDTIKGMLTTSAYTPNKDTHRYKSDVTNEITGTGYSAGGAALANKAFVYDAATDATWWDADDLTWASSTLTARKLVLYKDTGVAGTSPLIVCADNGADLISTGGPLTWVFDATGILRLTT